MKFLFNCMQNGSRKAVVFLFTIHSELRIPNSEFLIPHSHHLPSWPGLTLGILLPEGGMHMRPKRHRDMTEAIIRQQQEKNPWDVLGSWTGVPWDEDETPVQDADDL